MSDSNESSRQATHARQEGVDDNVAALAGPLIHADADGGLNDDADAGGVTPAGGSWSSSVNAAPVPEAKASGEPSKRWIAAAGMGIGSAALVAALLYANRGANRGKRDTRPSRDGY